MLERHFFFRGHFVFRFRHAEQPMVEPTNNVLQTLDPMPGLARARELVRFVREPHHHRRDLTKLECAEHFFASGAGRRAIICFAQDKHHRRLYILDVSDRRPRFEILFLVERRAFEPGWLKQSEVRRVPPMRPARDVTLRNRGCEAIGVADGPGRQQSCNTGRWRLNR